MPGQVAVRCDSAYGNHDMRAAAITGDARFSIPVRMRLAVTTSNTQIPNDAWVGSKYPHAIYDQEEHHWVCNAAVAESFHVRATTAAIRTRLSAIPARIARSAHRLHLPPPWPWETAWQAILTTAAGPPAPRDLTT